MNISAMRIRIIFQKNEVVEDAIGNHTNAWTDYFSCYATVVEKETEFGEKEVAAQTVVEQRVDFTVRYCSELSAVVPDKYRIIYKDRIYNILSVSDMAFKKKSLKMHTKLQRR